MSNYKDFSQYNEEAERIRPTARIQLIQRILNAANLISSLGQGVPLRWAQSYKGFQVLKYTENQDPTDVTSENAISAVDSILHEAESQLRASKDDMDALQLELQKMPVNGRAYWTAFPKVPNNVYIGLMSTGSINGVSYRLCIRTNDTGEINEKIYIMTGPKWNSLPNKRDAASDLTFSALWMSMPCGSEPLRPYIRSIRFINHSDFYDVTAGQYFTSSGVMRLFLQMCDHWVVNSTAVNAYHWGWEADVSDIQFPTDSDILIIPLSDMGTRDSFQFRGSAGNSPTIPIMGEVNTQVALGLPDPSNLIDILDHMTD